MLTWTILRTLTDRTHLGSSCTKNSMKPHGIRMQVNRPWNRWKKVTKTVKLVYEGFWCKNDKDILNRPNETAKKLKDRQAEMKKDAIDENSQTEDQVSPSDECFTCLHPVGHPSLKCDKDTLQQDLKEALHEIPVKPLTGPPKIVHPFPGTRSQTLLMPPLSVPANFAVKLNKFAKMKTSTPSTKTKMVTTIAIQPQVRIQKRSPEEIQSLSSSV